MGKDFGRRAMSRRAMSGLIGVSSPLWSFQANGIGPDSTRASLVRQDSPTPNGRDRGLYLKSRNVRVWINVPAPLGESRPEADSRRGKSTGLTCIR